MSMVCGLDLHREQITFDAVTTESGEVWRGRVWQPDRQRFRHWLRHDVARKANGQPGGDGWRPPTVHHSRGCDRQRVRDSSGDVCQLGLGACGEHDVSATCLG